jgi:hypothetical protein
MTTTKNIQDITLADLTSVYIGKNNTCCCGCAGDHTSTSHNTKPRSDVDDKRAQRVLNKLKKNAAIVDNGGNHFYAVFGTRIWIAYLD